jgi:undecaprenyl diphosphate synthase
MAMPDKKRKLFPMNDKKMHIPSHIAMIMDGNGRWANRQGKKRVDGHREGAKTVDRITESCARLGVKRLTLYAFSLENWKRPKLEVAALMKLLKEYLKRFLPKLMDNRIRLTAIGRIQDLPKGTRGALQQTMDATAGNPGMNLCLALSYGGRAEIVDAARALAEKAAAGELAPDEIDEELFASHIYQPGPDPDLIIRTAGEMRLSNFLLWEASYAEFYSTPRCWPEFTEEALIEAIEEYNQRIRKYGGLIEAEGARKC